MIDLMHLYSALRWTNHARIGLRLYCRILCNPSSTQKPLVDAFKRSDKANICRQWMSLICLSVTAIVTLVSDEWRDALHHGLISHWDLNVISFSRSNWSPVHHQQQCRTSLSFLIIKHRTFDKVECCFDIVAVLEYLFQTNDKGRLAPLTCHEYGTFKHILGNNVSVGNNV